MALSNTKTELIDIAERCSILKFGSFTLKSKRTSPYFLNCGLFLQDGLALTRLSQAYAAEIHTYAQHDPDFGFDVLFGPAYKGIPFAATTTVCLAQLDESKWGHAVGVSFNRKEVKDHGEGGLLVGAGLKGKRVVIIDDVITAGTAIREAIEMIDAQGGKLVGILIAINRQEKVTGESEKEGKGDDGQPRPSAIGEVRREYGVPVLSVLTLEDLIAAMKLKGRGAEVEQMEEYRSKYGATD
ncbi:orotate phosphoribosyltransferase [Polychaeton citri CBS 116435]|uniref:Orotate phosphoribosyltransferase n=1 Tax=Polychaeton citri CBS 116435 TaxID=1314669 RepID=A0A9P4UUL4_9PEZI|nr:orotate phosphoribosyltransferase [Polychaeton citri CBS 116435]